MDPVPRRLTLPLLALALLALAACGHRGPLVPPPESGTSAVPAAHPAAA
jgi:predicted small lipoprotein YifL